MKACIIGAGRIGTALYKRLIAGGWEVGGVLDVDGIYTDPSMREKIGEPGEWGRYFEGSDVAFLAIPTHRKGDIAYAYIQSLTALGIPTVTCEKGAMSNFYQELENRLDMIGFSATVGGGTRMLRFLRERGGPEVRELHGVANGTLTYISDEVSKGAGLTDAANRAKERGYAEPGAETAHDVIRAEACQDVPMKSTIVFNIGGFGQPVRARDIGVDEFGEDEFKALLDDFPNRRYIVSITREQPDGDAIGGFSHRTGDWVIYGGFRRVGSNPLFERLVLSGVDNGLVICEDDDTYTLTGSGAGPRPTTLSMLRDARKLTRQ